MNENNFKEYYYKFLNFNEKERIICSNNRCKSINNFYYPVIISKFQDSTMYSIDPDYFEKLKEIIIEEKGYEVIQGRGKVTGKLLGGCLDAFPIYVGTAVWPSLKEWQDKILFLETSEDMPVLYNVVVLACIVSIAFKVKKEEKINIKNKKVIVILITIIILVGIGLSGVKIYQQLHHNEVSKKDRIALETYILDNYGLELKVKESTVIHRGNIGENPGIEYTFVLQNSMGFEYHLDINRYTEIDLKTIQAEKPELSLYK